MMGGMKPSSSGGVRGDSVRTMRVPLSDGAEAVFTDHDNGKTSGLPVVLLHGLTQQQHYWGPVLAQLAGRRVITVDQRGHGEASGSQVTPQSDFSIPRLAQDVIELLDQAGVPEAVVVGHSWGASVALHTASTFPDRVRAAVLIDGGIFGPRHLVSSDRSAEEVREALRPPALGIAETALGKPSSQAISRYWSDDIRRALATFRVDEDGRAFTRLGMDRHMAVLDGLFAYDPLPISRRRPDPRGLSSVNRESWTPPRLRTDGTSRLLESIRFRQFNRSCRISRTGLDSGTSLGDRSTRIALLSSTLEWSPPRRSLAMAGAGGGSSGDCARTSRCWRGGRMIELDGIPTLSDPVMIAAFEGWNDAGESASATITHLREVWGAELITEFDSEDYYDYQVNRPDISVDSAGVRQQVVTAHLFSSCTSFPRDGAGQGIGRTCLAAIHPGDSRPGGGIGRLHGRHLRALLSDSLPRPVRPPDRRRTPPMETYALGRALRDPGHHRVLLNVSAVRGALDFMGQLCRTTSVNRHESDAGPRAQDRGRARHPVPLVTGGRAWESVSTGLPRMRKCPITSVSWSGSGDRLPKPVERHVPFEQYLKPWRRRRPHRPAARVPSSRTGLV